jgi:hypothetical protein
MTKIVSHRYEPVREMTGQRLLRRVAMERVSIEFDGRPGDKEHSLIRRLLPELSSRWYNRLWHFRVDEDRSLNTLRVYFRGWQRKKACQQFVNALKVYKTTTKEEMA